MVSDDIEREERIYKEHNVDRPLVESTYRELEMYEFPEFENLTLKDMLTHIEAAAVNYRQQSLAGVVIKKTEDFGMIIRLTRYLKDILPERKRGY